MADQTLRVLLIDDEQGAYEMTRAMMGNIKGVDYDVEWAATYDEGLVAMKADAHDLYLVDYLLDDRDGIDLIHEAKRYGLHGPIIMLTGRGSHQVDVDAMAAGADDFLVKSKIDPESLERSIRYARERNQAQAALRESEERHRGMFDHLPLGLYRVTQDGQLVDANPALIRLLGHPDRDILDRTYARNKFVNAKDKQGFEALIRQYGVVMGFESQLTTVDGRHIRVRISARGQRGPEGELVYLEGTLEDVTEERALAGMVFGEARFRSIFDTTGHGIAVLDLAGDFLEINPALREVFGYSGEELKGRSSTILLAEEGTSSFPADVRSMAAGAISRSRGEHRLKRKDGSVAWARVSAVLIRDRAGKPDHILMMMEDVSEAGVMAE